jgi:two-component system, OmpR family, sensor kinase
MTTRRPSLLHSLFKSLIIPSMMASVLGVFVVFGLVKEEYDELLDVSLVSKANLLLEVLEASGNSAPIDLGALMTFEGATLDVNERSMFWFFDDDGQIIAASPAADANILTELPEDGLGTAQGHRISVVKSSEQTGSSVVVATPMTERNEAILDVLLGVIFGFALLGLLFAVATFWAMRRTVADIAMLSANIAQKSERDLSPIERHHVFTEIEPAITTLDKLMARLDVALTGERAFATNAAHELRTPLAICLAHVQRLKTKLTDPAQSDSAAEIEQGLKRLIRLIERLLQMSRAQSGLGTSAITADINPVICLMLNELRDRELPEIHLVMKYPKGVWLSRIDPDAIGIMLNNLFENALKYASGPMPTVIDASVAGKIVISNDCLALAASDLAKTKDRFVRNAPMSDGFGVGLSIVQSLSEQSGCVFDIFSPQQGESRGFSAVLKFPPVG